MKEAIEALIQRGRLEKYRRQDPGQSNKKDDKQYNEIAIIAGGPHIASTSRRAQKSYIREVDAHSSWVMFTSNVRPSKLPIIEREEIKFFDEDGKWVQFPHNDPIVIKATIGNHVVGRILIDNGSSVDILYGDTF